MKLDLQKLEISDKEIKQIIGKNLTKNSKITFWGTVWRTIIIWFISLLSSGIIDPNYETSFSTICLIIFFFAPFIAMIWQKINLSGNDASESIKNLMEEVGKFNLIIKAIDVNDQLVDAGNKGMESKERQKAIQALEFAREDLVKALKTEKILRENEDIVSMQSDYLSNNLSNLASLQVDDTATQYGKILSDALAVARDVHEEMAKVKKR